MPLRIRLQRLGARNLPIFRMVVANARAPRNGKHIERLGVYNPRPDSEGIKHITLNIERAKYWLSVGAQPTERVEKLFANAGLVPQPRRHVPPQSKSVLLEQKKAAEKSANSTTTATA